MTDSFETKVYDLIESWNRIRARLKADRDRDEAAGLTQTAEVGEIAILTMDACIGSLTDILPPKP